MSGHFIAFEGGEGTGKSTQARRLAERLGRQALFTFEPGDTPLGAEVRRLVLDSPDLDITDRAEALLMAADRAQHVAQVIEPALDAGRTVICDRFAGSSIAYQGHGRQLPAGEVEQLSRWATLGRWPDLIVLLEVLPDLAAQRLRRTRDRLGPDVCRIVANNVPRTPNCLYPDTWLTSLTRHLIVRAPSALPPLIAMPPAPRR